MGNKEVFVRKNTGCNRGRKLLQGVGVNDANYAVTATINGTRTMCPYYRTWHNMIHRCYNPNYKRANITYEDCTVYEDWHTFSTFSKWMGSQDWEGKVLDKDLLIRSNKMYSPDTCIFLRPALNSSLIEGHKARGNYLAGVSRYTEGGKYIANLSRGKSSTNSHLGSFPTEIEAHNTWRIAKSKQLLEAANNEVDVRVVDALRVRANELLVLTPNVF